MESFISSYGLIILMVVFFVFFIILPQRKRQKKEKAFAAAIKKGDRVIMKSGMHGKIFDFSDKMNAVIIETGAGKITFDRSSISIEMTEKLSKEAAEKK